MTITAAHEKYNEMFKPEEEPEDKSKDKSKDKSVDMTCSLGFFAAARPRNVRKLGSIPPATCLCPKCANVG